MEDWVKLSVRYYADARIEALPDADAEIMFTRGLARAGEVGREGFIPESSLPLLARKRRYAASVDSLVTSGLWTRVPGGYQVTNWDHWQDGIDVLAKRRATDRERKRASRAADREEKRGGSAPSFVEQSTVRGHPVDNPVDESTVRGQSADSGSRDHATSWNVGRVAESLVNSAQAADQHKQVPVRGLSADASADFRAAEGEGEGDRGWGRRVSYGRASPDEPPPIWTNNTQEPPRACRDHRDDPDPPACGRCADARRTHEAWHAERRTRLDQAPKCRTHVGQLATNCSGCAADAKAAP